MGFAPVTDVAPSSNQNPPAIIPTSCQGIKLPTDAAVPSKAATAKPFSTPSTAHNNLKPPLTEATLTEQGHIQPYEVPDDEYALMARAEALQRAGRDLGFELPVSSYMPERRDMNGWTKDQADIRGRFAEDQGTRPNQ